MFWDKVSPVYDLFEKIYNRKVYTETGKIVADIILPSDNVLECACGTGEISRHIAGKCRKLLATDVSAGMLRQALKKCRGCRNITFRKADIMNMKYKDGCFDKAVAANVIHLLENPEKALHELERLVRPGGKIIIPTYINAEPEKILINQRFHKTAAVRLMELIGVKFRRQFDLKSYKKFFSDLGYEDTEYCIAEGRMPCAIAIISRK